MESHSIGTNFFLLPDRKKDKTEMECSSDHKQQSSLQFHNLNLWPQLQGHIWALKVIWLVQKFLAFMKPRTSLLCLHKTAPPPSTLNYVLSKYSSVYIITVWFSKMHFHIILSFMSRSSKMFLPLIIIYTAVNNHLLLCCFLLTETKEHS